MSLNKRERIILPIAFGEKKKEKIEGAFEGQWSFTTVEMVKRNGEWYAHFVLSKIVELPDEPETVIAIDRGEHNLAAAVAISKQNPEKPTKGQFWRGEEIKRVRGLYGHIRRELQEKHRVGKTKHSERERRRVNQQIHVIANQIIEYVKQFPEPIIVMENVNGIRRNFKKIQEPKQEVPQPSNQKATGNLRV